MCISISVFFLPLYNLRTILLLLLFIVLQQHRLIKFEQSVKLLTVNCQGLAERGGKIT